MRDEKVIIGLCGKIASGKSTAASYLETRYGFKRVRFAGPLKAMMAALGLSHAEIEGHLKERPCDLLGGKTPRFAMQTLGTEWGRNLIDSELWVRAWLRATEGWPLVVADDVRFPNEAKAVRDAGGLLIRIERPLPYNDILGHASEEQNFPVDRVVQNNAGIRELADNIESHVEPQLAWRRAKFEKARAEQ
jgi:hypothetical protein